MFEPGSIMKTFSIANALASGKYTPDSIVNVWPGTLELDGHVIHDDDKLANITVTQVLVHSSNIGVTKMTLSLPPEGLYDLWRRMGFGQSTESGFPGEADGSLIKDHIKRPFDLATMAFGYGLSVTALQLANAYAAVAREGIKIPPTFVKISQAPSGGKRVMSAKVAEQMLTMLEAVAQLGSGKLGQIPGYRMGGKTGTAYMASTHGYIKNHYESSFIGIAPLSNPQLVVAVTLHDVHGGKHFAAEIAAPAFGIVMGGALRYLDIPPDSLAVNGSAKQ